MKKTEDPKDGRTGNVIVMPSDVSPEFQRHRQSFLDEYKPQDRLEEMLVENLSWSSWHLDYVSAQIHNILSSDSIDDFMKQMKTFNKMSALESTLRRNFHSALQMLKNHQARRKREAEPRRQGKVVKMPKIEDLPDGNGFVC